MQGIKLSGSYVGARLDVALITILGYVDTTTCQELTKVIRELVKQKRYQIIADLGGVSYVSSAGWGVFVGEIKNIREKGGDIKIVQMSPEVFEVFEMLEFNRILNHYESIEEAIDEFDIIRGIDITKVQEGVREARETPPLGDVRYPRSSLPLEDRRGEEGAPSLNSKVPVKDFPLMEKIKLIVIENPFLGTRGICRQLRTEEYGSVRVGFFRMRAFLRKLNLETKEKRYRFYRSR